MARPDHWSAFVAPHENGAQQVGAASRKRDTGLSVRVGRHAGPSYHSIVVEDVDAAAGQGFAVP